MAINRTIGTGIRGAMAPPPVTNAERVNLPSEIPDPHRRRQAWSPRVTALQVSITDIPGITDDNVQGALEELQAGGGGGGSLQDAYDDGNAIVAVAGVPVEITGSGLETDSIITPITGLTEIVGDPAAVANRGYVYTKDAVGITQLFYRASNGTITQITPGGGAVTEKTWAFRTRGSGAGTWYWGGYYDFGATDNDFNPGIPWGTADAAYGAHFFIVTALHGGGGDTEITVSGTSITDTGVRDATPDTEVITIPTGSPADSYFETTKKWIGQVTVTKTAGNDTLCNYGWAKYWDNNNNNFIVQGLEATWLAAASDDGFDILLRHHKSTGWTYNNGAEPTPPTAIATLQTDYVTEYETINGEEGAWKRTNLLTAVLGSVDEGTIVEVVSTASNTIELGNFMMRVIAT